MFRWIFVAFISTWVLLGAIGNLQIAQSARVHRREPLGIILNIATALPLWVPLVLMLLVLGVWYWIEQGSPPWSHKSKSKEDEVP